MKRLQPYHSNFSGETGLSIGMILFFLMSLGSALHMSNAFSDHLLNSILNLSVFDISKLFVDGDGKASR